MVWIFFLSGLLAQLTRNPSPLECISSSVDQLGLVMSKTTVSGFLPSYCISACQNENYQIAYLAGAYNSKCYCSISLPPSNVNRLDINLCNQICADGVTPGCGGIVTDPKNVVFAVYDVIDKLVKIGIWQ